MKQEYKASLKESAESKLESKSTVQFINHVFFGAVGVIFLRTLQPRKFGFCLMFPLFPVWKDDFSLINRVV